MNAQARALLRQAALAGVPQAFEMFRDGLGGLCALGVLGYDADFTAAAWRAYFTSPVMAYAQAASSMPRDRARWRCA